MTLLLLRRTDQLMAAPAVGDALELAGMASTSSRIGYAWRPPDSRSAVWPEEFE